MPGIGAPEMLIILGILVLIFGAGKLPEIGGSLGKGIREFKAQTTGEAEVVPQPVPVAVATESDMPLDSHRVRADEI